jgi:hypothetical protein
MAAAPPLGMAIPTKKAAPLLVGKRLLDVRTLSRPSYAVEATSQELSLGMPQICTSDMAARG